MKDFSVGQGASLQRTFTQEDLVEYASLAGIARPELTRVPPPLLGGLFSYLLGTTLPGPGTNYLKQKLSFRAPLRVGEAVTATVEITRWRPEKALVNLRTTCVTASGQVVCAGEALVLVKDVQ